MLRLPNGDIMYSGNVLFTTTDLDTSLLSFSAENVNELEDGSIVLNGTVRISFGSYILTTERAVVRKDGTISMDLARLSNEG